MENASKALLMAASVLISVLIISALVLMYRQLTALPRAQEEALEEEQLIAFNKQYESYNRKNLRGTDVISVINKAIDSNERYGATDTSDPYFVNVQFTLKTEVGQTIETHEKVGNNWKVTTNPQIQLSAKKTYSLDSNFSEIEQFVEMEYKSKAETYPSDQYGNPDSSLYDAAMNGNGKIYYMTSNPFVTFKRKTFECTNIQYNDARRVETITFEET